MMLYGLAGLGVIIVIGLAYYAGQTLSQLNAQKTRIALAKQKQYEVRVERVNNIMQSVHTIALAVEQQQCDLCEGVIRLTNLLDALPLNPAPKFMDIYPNIYTLHTKIDHYPTHDARNALSKKERHQQDLEREAIAATFESAIISEVVQLRTYHPTI